jgi:ADP-heptose:LPS heptosyltransferase
VPPAIHHRVEDWWEVQRSLSSTATTLYPPRLAGDPETIARYRALFERDSRPVLLLHCGARNAIRRWPEDYFRKIVSELRAEFDFQLALCPDTDGYGEGLHDLAEHTFSHLSLRELEALVSCAALLMGNDSGPGHLADALEVPAIVIFGPGNSDKMRPFRKQNLIVMRDICPYHPCSDYCRFPEPYCLTQLTPAIVGPEIRNYLREIGCFPLRAGAPVGQPTTNQVN